MSVVTLLPEVKAFLARQHGHFIDGKAVAGKSSNRISIVNPTTGLEITTIADANDDEINDAVVSSKSAFRGGWARTSPAERGIALNRLADLMIAHREELAQIETVQSGKIIHISRGVEVDYGAAFLRYYAGWTTKITGETIPISAPTSESEQFTAFTRREPVGVVVGIVPWNFSTLIAIWKVGSALATGCTSIIKPSEFTPLTILRIAELAIEAGIPAGTLNVVTGSGKVGAALISHPGTAKVSFTGAVPTGIAVGRAAVDAGLKRSTLQLGGKNAVGFLADVDTEKAVAGIIEAGFGHQGQICAAGERFYVHRTRIDEILEKLKDRLSNIRVGDPLDESTEFGPLSNKPHLDKIARYFARAREENNDIVFGGEVIDRPGFFVSPTVVRVNKPDAFLMREETFGPIGTFLPYDDEDELVSLMNDTSFGLSASIWTNNLSKALRLIPKIEAGMVWVNSHASMDPAVPFGGIKSSGIGREFGSAFIDDFTEIKSVIIRH